MAGCLYWRSLRSTPQYSLALLVDAAKRGDNAAVDSLIDSDAVVDDFMPQVTGESGRNWTAGDWHRRSLSQMTTLASAHPAGDQGPGSG